MTRVSRFNTMATAESDVELYVDGIRCAQHPTKLLNMFCREHDVVACAVCFKSNHKCCDDAHYLPDIIKTMHIPDEIPKAQIALKELEDKLEILKKGYEKFRNDVKKSKKVIHQDIEKFKVQIIGRLDEMEKASIAELEIKTKDLKNNLKIEIQKLESMIEDTGKNIKCLETLDEHMCKRFVNLKLSQQHIAAANNLYSDMISHHKHLTFKPNNGMMDYLNQLHSLGAIENKPCLTEMLGDNCMKRLSKSISVVSQSPTSPDSESVEVNSIVSKSGRKKKIGLYKVKIKNEYNVRLVNDQWNCYLKASCIFNTGEVVLADSDNMKLKLLDKNTFQVLKYCMLPDSPTSVCCLSSSEVAVSLSNRTIQYVCVGEQLVSTRILRMIHDCQGIEVSNGKLYVSDDYKSVHVYTLDGMLLRTIDNDKNGKHIFSRSCGITLNDEGTVAHVADWQRGLITMNIHGHVLWKHSGSDLRNIRDVCIDGDGNVLVCGYDSHNVIQFDKDGKKLGEVISETQATLQPLSLCLDRNTNRLIITYFMSENVCVYLLE